MHRDHSHENDLLERLGFAQLDILQYIAFLLEKIEKNQHASKFPFHVVIGDEVPDSYLEGIPVMTKSTTLSFAGMRLVSLLPFASSDNSIQPVSTPAWSASGDGAASLEIAPDGMSALIHGSTQSTTGALTSVAITAKNANGSPVTEQIDVTAGQGGQGTVADNLGAQISEEMPDQPVGTFQFPTSAPQGAFAPQAAFGQPQLARTPFGGQQGNQSGQYDPRQRGQTGQPQRPNFGDPRQGQGAGRGAWGNQPNAGFPQGQPGGYMGGYQGQADPRYAGGASGQPNTGAWGGQPTSPAYGGGFPQGQPQVDQYGNPIR